MKMKERIVWMFVFGGLMTGCRNFIVDDVKLFMPGTYTRFAEHEFGKEYDTITISLDDEAAEAYKIVRRWQYERVRDGEWLEPEYKVTKTMGYYQRSKRYLWENGSGTIYHFDPKLKLLKNGSINYTKL